MQLASVLAEELDNRGGKGKVQLKLSGCHGLCQQGPVVVVEPERIFYRGVGRKNLVADANDIAENTILGGRPVERLLYKDPQSKQPIVHYDDLSFYSRQKRIVLRNNGRIDPHCIEDYIAEDGYAALAGVVTMDPSEVISWIRHSGLRGRGGAGFLTGQKWSACRQASNNYMRYIICNSDEGDPGAFMDRSIVEGDPHAVLEGMIIGAYAISQGISPAEGYVYIRAEYPLAVETLRSAIEQAENLGLLGNGILGTDFNFHVKLVQGAGAFVCGEETALLASLEGFTGEPRQRPPFPAQKGLWGQPTNINNVETWANVPRIILDGPEKFSRLGTESSKGTKVFSLVGKVTNTGLIEVPMGLTLREIIFDIGGGVAGNKCFKAVQTGGPSGGCIPERFLDIPVDFENLAEVGSIMGSGGMIVMDEQTCMVDVARYFLDFLKEESCGKCTPCREGIEQMLSILNAVCEGRGNEEDLKLLEELAQTVQDFSLCGLGQTAPNPVLTTLRYFKDEYLSHIRDHKCPAGVCKALVTFTIDPDACTGCAACVKMCPSGAISGEKKKTHVIDQASCIKCNACYEVCKFGAVQRT
jgi:NADH-quinone oxidoreductase subunit F